MNCHELRDRMAEFISGEADIDTRTAMSAHLDVCKECRHEARSLAAAAEAIEAGLPSMTVAERVTQDILADVAANQAASRVDFSKSESDADIRRGKLSARPVSRGMWTWSVLRYAAVILAAFGGGYWFARTPAGEISSPTERPVVHEPARRSMEPIEARFAKRFEDAARTYPSSSSLSWSLLSIARR